jgi:aminopeptidase
MPINRNVKNHLSNPGKFYMPDSFEQDLQKYAEIIIRVGLNLQPGQRLVIQAPVEALPLARLVTARAYQAGARYVDTIYEDDQATLARFRFAPRDSFTEDRVWLGRMLDEHGRTGNAYLRIYAEDPDLLKGQDPELVSQYKRTILKNRKAFSDQISHNAVNWCLVSAPLAGWAAKVFPDLTPVDREKRLWQSIFEATYPAVGISPGLSQSKAIHRLEIFCSGDKPDGRIAPGPCVAQWQYPQPGWDPFHA